MIKRHKNREVTGDFVQIHGERYYKIGNVDQIPPFLINIVSESDHWLFIASNGALTAGRISPEKALFPYLPVDKLYESNTHTGSKTIIWTENENSSNVWEPFNYEQYNRYALIRNIYKNQLGNKLLLEEINNDIELIFRYNWSTSDKYGFIRQSELINLSDKKQTVEIVDGVQNILPTGAPKQSQTNSSNLVDAYKWNELNETQGLAIFSLYSGITDRPEPYESLMANVAYCVGVSNPKYFISSEQLETYKVDRQCKHETLTRGIRGAYFINKTIELSKYEVKQWKLVLNTDQSQCEIVDLKKILINRENLERSINKSIEEDSNTLAKILATCDALQVTEEEDLSVHHHSNVLYNILRGGAFINQYNIHKDDYCKTIRIFNKEIYHRNLELLNNLPSIIDHQLLMKRIEEKGDHQLLRLSNEYLPIFFGRRHGDPSRPWNQFTINVKDKNNTRTLYYEGNWRDIFQNWEALLLSYPAFTEVVIAKFLNASTMDGYNPYRINKYGIDWEVEEPDDPWSNIGYWGDHQIIYLLKLLELSNKLHPTRLGKLLRSRIYGYANIPYRIKPFESLIKDTKNTIVYDDVAAKIIDERVDTIGADGKQILDKKGDVYLVNLFEKLIVTLLCKLSNFVLDGGIWLNTQRPEWNDANNALVGQGLSMVTLYYLRRYIAFLEKLLTSETESIVITQEVHIWLESVCIIIKKIQHKISINGINEKDRYSFLKELGEAYGQYRISIYRNNSFNAIHIQSLEEIKSMLSNALKIIDYNIEMNRRADGMYHAYNFLNFDKQGIKVDNLYLMLEGQVAALSSGAVEPKMVVELLEALFNSDIYRDDQQAFMLYPDRKLPGFLEKNKIEREQIKNIPLLISMISNGDESIVQEDADGQFRFNSNLTNVDKLNKTLRNISDTYEEVTTSSIEAIQLLYEKVFNHKSFTGRSGGMFGFEGLGCVYWHMVAKLLLSVQENYFSALDKNINSEICRQIGYWYYRIRSGLGFNKTPQDYGAFPYDAYSHTPKHAGAQQPGMTGQVKEEIITRFGELGVRIDGGKVKFQPKLLRAREFLQESKTFRYLDIRGNWREITIPKHGLAFTFCQVPVVYELCNDKSTSLTITRDDGSTDIRDNISLSRKYSSELFKRSGSISKIRLSLNTNLLFDA